MGEAFLPFLLFDTPCWNFFLNTFEFCVPIAVIIPFEVVWAKGKSRSTCLPPHLHPSSCYRKKILVNVPHVVQFDLRIFSGHFIRYNLVVKQISNQSIAVSQPDAYRYQNLVSTIWPLCLISAVQAPGAGVMVCGTYPWQTNWVLVKKMPT